MKVLILTLVILFSVGCKEVVLVKDPYHAYRRAPYTTTTYTYINGVSIPNTVYHPERWYEVCEVQYDDGSWGDKEYEISEYEYNNLMEELSR